jgi:hypothetical protein
MEKKEEKSTSSISLSLEEVKKKILEESSEKWSTEFIQKALQRLRLSLSGTRENQAKRLTALKDNPKVLDKICEKESKKYRFSCHLNRSDIPGVQAAWNSDSKLYPKV